MASNKQKINWILDLLMLAGFLISFFLDFTGLEVHQWLGVLLAVFMIIHLIIHVDWVKSVIQRFFGNTSMRARVYAVIDFLIMLSVVMILETGLIISTWLNLNLSNYGSLSNLHTWLSISTLALLVIKIGLHWRWVVKTAQKIFRPASVNLPPKAGFQPGFARASQPVSKDRRQFLVTMGLVSLGSALAIHEVLQANLPVQAVSSLLESDAAVNQDSVTSDDVSQITATETQAATVEPTSTSTTVVEPTATTEVQPTATTEVQPTATTETVVSNSDTTISASTCQIRCRKGCMGHGCRRYVDSNGNGYCDQGECM